MSKKIIADIYPLSPTQEGMLYHYLAGASPEQYVEQTCLTVQGTLNLEQIEFAWNMLTERHEILRTVFRWEGVDRPLQVVLQSRLVRLKRVDLREYAGSAPADQLEELMQRDRQEGFDLAKGPLNRVTVCQLSEDTYAIIWSFHHIIMDGWSTAIVWRELFQIYLGSALAQTEALKYREYIRFLETQDKVAIARYWHQYLQGFSEPTPLPCEHTSDLFENVADYRVRLTDELTQNLQLLARTQRVTVNQIFQAAWGILLQRYNNTDDAVFGITVSGRPPHLLGIQDSVGLFINTIPVRIKITSDATVQSLLGHLSKESFERSQREYLALTEIKAQSELPAQVPLFDNIIVYENYPIDEGLTALNLGLQLLATATREMTNYNLTITAIMQERMQLNFSYNPARYTAAGIARAAEHLQNLLGAMVQNPGSRIMELEMLAPVEKQELLTQACGPVLPSLEAYCLHELVEAQVARTPDAIALKSGDAELTYRELDTTAAHIADQLRVRGVGADTLVGVMLERSMEMMISLLAILKAGGAYLPLDPVFPAERIRYMLEDSGAMGLITTEQHRSLVPEEFEGWVLLADAGSTCVVPEGGTIEQCRGLHDDLQANALRCCSSGKSDEAQLVCPHSLAYIIYTSGSTGQPKGIEIEHRSAVNLLRSLQQVLPVEPGQRFLALTTICFDISVLELFWTLASGLCVVLAESEAQRDPVALNQLLEEEQIWMVQMTPSTLQMLISMNFSAGRQMSHILLGGEPLPDTVLHWLQSHTTARIFNMYGPTETTVWSTWREVTTDEHATLGQPIHHTQVFILDQHHRLMPRGVVGEVYIAGAGLARGYLRRPELTHERFLLNPFGEGRMYQTGDLARWLPDGSLEYHGRKDSQVKVRGFRVEIGEVEARLTAHPAIRESAVLARTDAAGDGMLIGYVVPEEAMAADADLSAKALRHWLAGALPEYMIPSTFVLVEKLPLTPNGKLDRNALPDPGQSDPHGSSRVAPRNEREATIAAIWAEVLGQQEIGVEENFFEIGGHSLKVTRVLVRLQKAFAVQIPLQSFFANPTIAGLAGVIRRLEQKHYQEIPALPAQPHYPVSHSQRRLWILDRFEAHMTAYNMPAAYLLTGHLKQEALQKALQALVDRHESLRTSFAVVDGEPVQVIAAHYELPLGYTDLSGNKPWEDSMLYSPEIEHIVNTEAGKPFDLSQVGLFRVHLYRLAPDKHLILLTQHHIISDEWSTHLLSSELIRLYAAYVRGEEQPLPPLRIQYRDYAAWQKSFLTSDEMQEMEQYWRQTLSGELPKLHLPVDEPRPELRSYRGDFLEFALSPELAWQLTDLSQKKGTTLFMTLLSAYYVLLHQYSGAEDLIVGVPVAGRGQAELEQLIGFFVNSLALRIQLSREERFTELMQRVKEVAVQGFANQEYPFDLLVDQLALQRDPRRSPVFDVMFNLIHISADQPGSAHTLHSFEGAAIQTVEGLTFAPVKQETKTSKLDLTLTFLVQGHEIRGGFEYCSDLFTRETVQRMVQHYTSLLRAIVANPDTQVQALELLTPEEQLRIQAGVARSQQQTDPVKPEPSVDGTEYMAPRNALEEQLVQVWQEVLKIDQIGITDSFFTLGGNSLTIIQLFERLQSIISVPFSIATLFSYHTIAMFAEYIQTAGSLAGQPGVNERADAGLAGNQPDSDQNPASETTAELDDLFTRLANGELSPEEAAELLTGGR